MFLLREKVKPHDVALAYWGRPLSRTRPNLPIEEEPEPDAADLAY